MGCLVACVLVLALGWSWVGLLGDAWQEWAGVALG